MKSLQGNDRLEFTVYANNKLKEYERVSDVSDKFQD